MAHAEQMAFVAQTSRLFPRWFHGARVLEIGSRNINGTVRQFFADCDYTGLDCTPGPLVDVVCLAHAFTADEPFDTVVSCEAFEHDPYLPQTIARALDLLRPGGLFVATWASPLRGEHGTRRTGDVYSPDPDYYRGISAAEMLAMLAGRLDPVSVTSGSDGHDVYLLGFRRGDGR